jgi:hypothetical protein
MIDTRSTGPAEMAGLAPKHRDVSLHGTLWVLLACAAVLATLLFTAEPRSLQSSGTPMTVQDFEWAAGAKLLEYQLIDDGKAYDANLRVQVRLTVSRPGNEKAKQTEKTVWYLVGTSPSVTVFRDMLRR